MKTVAVCLITLVSFVAAAVAEPSPPDKADVATLLFGNPMWQKAPAGTTLKYSFSKKTGQAAFGPSFDDSITLTLDAGDSPETRTAEVRMFSGENAKPAGPFRLEKQNPALLLVMEYNVQELSKLFKANPRYLKNAIRKAWRDSAKITEGPIEVDGKSVPGTRIAISPFSNDEEKGKMMGLEGLTYTVEISKDVPGTIAAVDIRGPESGKSQFSETLRYRGEAEKKP